MRHKRATRNDIKDFAKWLQGREGEYNPSDPGNCLVCKYMRDRGFDITQFHGPTVLYLHREGDRLGYSVLLPKSIAEIAYGKGNTNLDKWHDQCGNAFEYTYEAAYKRAYDILVRMGR